MKKKLISLLTAVVMLISMTALNVSAATFEINFNAPGKIYVNGTNAYTADVTFAGKSGLLKFQNISATSNRRLELQNMGMTNAYIKANKYLLVDCYLDDATQETFGLGIQFCKMNTAGWVFANETNGGAYSSATTYPANQWVTVAIDCSTALGWIDSNYSTDILNQIRVKDFPIVSGDAAFYVSRVRFHHDIVEPLVYTDENGGKYTYLSEDGKVTVDGQELDTFKTTSEAFAALGTAGGTVYLDGELTAFTDDKTARGHILLRGLGDTEEDVARNVIKGIDRMEIRGGDFTLDYVTVEAYTNAENGLDYTSIYTRQEVGTNRKFSLVIGANVGSAGLATGSRVDYNYGNKYYPVSDKITINSGRFYSVTPLSNWGSRILYRNGSVEYTINGGEINALMAGSNNTWEWDQSKITGDVIYTINGGLFTNYMVMGSSIAQTTIEGNIIWTINGGWMDDRRIIGGNAGAAKKDSLYKTLNNVAAIVNLKGEKTGLAKLTLGTDGAKGKDISGNEIYILNNNEDNLGTKIADGSLAEYKMHVYYGKAEPVFAKDKEIALNSGGAKELYGGALTGFTLTPDEEGAVPYLNGTALTPNANGLYEIPADANNVMEIIFAKGADSKLISFKTTGAKAEAKIYNFTDSVMPMRVYVAQYEGDKLISVKSEARSFEKSGKVQIVGVDFEKAEEYTYRTFLWNDMTSLADDIDL